MLYPSLLLVTLVYFAKWRPGRYQHDPDLKEGWLSAIQPVPIFEVYVFRLGDGHVRWSNIEGRGEIFLEVEELWGSLLPVNLGGIGGDDIAYVAQGAPPA